MISFGSGIFHFEIISPDGSTWALVTVKADSVTEAARMLRQYPRESWITWAD